MIDTHCHILPKCDDGPALWNEALSMAREAARQGITTIVATPHHGKGLFDNPPDKIERRVRQLNQLLRASRIPLSVLPGQEFHLRDVPFEDCGFGNARLIAGGNRVLLELPNCAPPERYPGILRLLRSKGLEPIVAHPERFAPFIAEPELMAKWLEAGAYFQLTAPSLVGHHGPDTQRTAWTMARRGWAHLLASDAHDERKRPFRLREAYWMLEAGFGSELTGLLKSNAERLIAGEPLERMAPAFSQYA